MKEIFDIEYLFKYLALTGIPFTTNREKGALIIHCTFPNNREALITYNIYSIKLILISPKYWENKIDVKSVDDVIKELKKFKELCETNLYGRIDWQSEYIGKIEIEGNVVEGNFLTIHVPGGDRFGENTLGLLILDRKTHVFHANSCHLGCCQIYCGKMNNEEIEYVIRSGEFPEGIPYVFNYENMRYMAEDKNNIPE